MKEIEEIILRMTLEEKVAQMQQLSANATPKEIFEGFKAQGEIGSYLHVLGEETGEYLESAEDSRLKIPPIFGIDAIHGHALLKGATVFPSQLAMACSWNEGLVEKVGEITAKEVAADGLNWVFSPVLCLGRDLRWGRIDETFGEDAELSSRLGSAIIKGYQKDGLVAACAKHYLGYGEATGGRDSYDTEITERKAREVFLKPFKAAVDAGCMTFMTAYGSIDGTPLTISHRYLTEILKEEYGFDGFVVTDWGNFRSLVNGQKAFESMDEACIEGVKAGNDMSMNSYEFYSALVNAVKEGRIEESVIDDAVRRILRIKARLGLLDEEKPKRPSREVIGCDEHKKFNYKVAIESAVLLKNDGVLPLKSVKKIAVIGPNADDVRAQYGDWTYFSHPDPKPWETGKDGVYTVLKGIKEVYADSEILYEKGCSINDNDSDDILDEALSAASQADLVVVVLGDNLSQNGEGKDRANLVLSGRQNELIRRVKELNKPVICVLVNGKPLVLNEVEKYSDAIIETFNGGDMCGLAIANLMKGNENFSGKLPISFPYDSSATPCYYNQYDYWHYYRKYIDVPAGSPYPFGYGLSYSKFDYGDLKGKVENGNVKLSLTVKNVSNTNGEEVVQLYYKDKICKILTPVRTLLDFKRVYVPANASAIVEFEIPVQSLGYYNQKCEYTVDAGEFEFYVSGDGKNFVKTSLKVA
ncbi:MAG: glycoside hydrolase family 3 N-terminal domain-containing protein [Candidatus Coproplasma sp.]